MKLLFTLMPEAGAGAVACRWLRKVTNQALH